MKRTALIEIDTCNKCPYCSTVFDRDDDGEDWHLKCNKQGKYIARWLRINQFQNYDQIDEGCPFFKKNEDDTVQ